MDPCLIKEVTLVAVFALLVKIYGIRPTTARERWHILKRLMRLTRIKPPKYPKRALAGAAALTAFLLTGVPSLYLFFQAVAPLEKTEPMEHGNLLVLIPKGISDIRLYFTVMRDTSRPRAAEQPINFPLLFTVRMRTAPGGPQCLPFILMATGEAVFGEKEGEYWIRNPELKSIDEKISDLNYGQEDKAQTFRVETCIDEDRDYSAMLEFIKMQGVMLADNGRSTFYRLPPILAVDSGMTAEELLKTPLDDPWSGRRRIDDSDAIVAIKDCKVKLGLLSAVERVEVRPASRTADSITWEDEDCALPKSALVSNVMREDQANTRLFWSAALIGLAISLLVFGVERLLEAYAKE